MITLLFLISADQTADVARPCAARGLLHPCPPGGQSHPIVALRYEYRRVYRAICDSRIVICD